MIHGNAFAAVSCFLFASPKIGGCIYSVSWMNCLSNWRLAKVASCWVCEIRKIAEFAALLLVNPSSSRHIKTDIKQVECHIIFSVNIYLFKVNIRKTSERFEIVQN